MLLVPALEPVPALGLAQLATAPMHLLADLTVVAAAEAVDGAPQPEPIIAVHKT